MRALAKYFLLPKETTEVELRHVVKINKVALLVCWLHLPLFLVVAWLCNTSMLQALGFGVFLALGPTLGTYVIRNPRNLSLLFGCTAMALGALLVHLGQGPVQIEMHFHFFASLALLTVWGNPTIIWVAAVTVALHHAGFWLFFPKSVFNYDAQLWVVAVHAAFVVVESIAAAFIARNFYDNVIGLDKIVQARTKDIRNILDNVTFGMFIADRDMKLIPGYSSSCSLFFQSKADDFVGHNLTDLLGLSNRDKDSFYGLYEQIFLGNGLEEFAISQLPTRFHLSGGESSRASGGEVSRAIGLTGSIIRGSNGEVTGVMFCISDDTSLVKAEADVQRTQSLLKIVAERKRFRIFAGEIHASFQEIRRNLAQNSNVETKARTVLHTLKGGFGVYGLSELVAKTHAAESAVPLRPSEVDDLEHTFRKLLESHVNILNMEYGGEGDNSTIEVNRSEVVSAIKAASSVHDKQQAFQLLQGFLETSCMPTASELMGPVEEFVTQLARRFEKRAALKVSGFGVRMPEEMRPLMSTMQHLFRNSLDHGIESPSKRGSKPAVSAIELSLAESDSQYTITYRDDGRGIDEAAVKRRALERGILAADLVNSLSGAQLHQLIFEPGFSTASSLSDVSGRGLGMSAVRQEAERLGGSARVFSQPGQGMSVEIIVPKLRSSLKRAA
jgi:signal transduction histidine kinase/PAS domain-containing protein